jgi:hypothetical protein
VVLCLRSCEDVDGFGLASFPRLAVGYLGCSFSAALLPFSLGYASPARPQLPYRVRWQDLKDLFRRAGTVLRADVSLDPQSNRSRGHGTVLMGSQEDGVKAIGALRLSLRLRFVC